MHLLNRCFWPNFVENVTNLGGIVLKLKIVKVLTVTKVVYPFGQQFKWRRVKFKKKKIGK